MKLLKPDNPEILSVVVMKENKIIAQTQQTEILYPQYSIMKSLVALVIGNLLENQKLTLETTVGEVLNTGNVPISNISLEKLLSMQSGMQEKLLFADRTTCKDYIKACCEMNVKNKQEFLYSNACAYLAGRIAETQEKISLESQIISMLFKPLNLKNYEFEYDTEGRVFGASGLKLKTEDLAKIGRGILEHKICSAKWQKNFSSTHAISNDGKPYGYFFWILENGFYMSGKWGQRCFMFPEYQAVIAINSNMQKQDIINYYMTCELLPLLEVSHE